MHGLKQTNKQTYKTNKQGDQSFYKYIDLFGVRLHGIDRRKLEKNTGLPVLWIPL